jgi:tRNA wybutosine-synthesizing protein 4
MNSGVDFMTKSTADDALSSKASACQLKYFNDPFVSTMLTKSHGALMKAERRRQPIINRGYFARIETIRVQLSKFMQKFKEGPIQIISFGCGFDTMSLNMLHELQIQGRESTENETNNTNTNTNTNYNNDITFYEVDFMDVVRNKERYLRSEDLFMNVLYPNESDREELSVFNEWTTLDDVDGSSSVAAGSSGSSGGMIHCTLGSKKNYKLIGCDLRKSKNVKKVLLDAGINPNIPCAIISECTLVYIKSKHSSLLLRDIASIFNTNTPNMWLSYDMTHSNDTYGRVMLRNLTNAGYKVPSFTDLPTIDLHKKLFETAGWGEPVKYVPIDDLDADAVDGFDKIEVPITAIEEGDGSESDCENDDKNNNTIHITVPTGTPTATASPVSHVASFGSVSCITMLEAWNKLIDNNDKIRVSKLEIFDEIEEWNMLMSHYCLITALRNVRFD